MDRLFVVAGALSGFVGVAAGAFGAHALRSRVAPDLLSIWNTGAQYMLVHALALVLVGTLAARAATPSSALTAAGWCFLAGIVLFSGSLYALVLTGVRGLGAVTPVGGVAFLAGWATLAIAALGAKR